MSNDSKEESRSDDQNLFPEKPLNENGFKKAVAWFGGRELIASLKGMVMYAIYGENIDPRSWMNPNKYPNVLEKILHKKEIEERSKLENAIQPETGDGKMRYADISQKATENLKEKPDVKNDISVSVEQDWAKKTFDQWQWKRENYKIWEEFSKNEKFWQRVQPQNQTLDEFWFDYIADSGDGQLGVYGVACLCLSDLWLEKSDLGKSDNEDNLSYPQVTFMPPDKSKLEDKILLPRGSFLFVGGDTAYHASNYATLVERFQHPFRWAFSSVREFAEKNYLLKDEKKNAIVSEENAKERQELPGSLPGWSEGIEYTDTEPMRPIFGIPANHDYYDGIDGFNRLFRKPPFENIEENMVFNGKRGKFLLRIPTFSRKQEASYIAIRLPFEWWMFGIDSENEKLDFRQEFYFTDIVTELPTKLILATPEPTTVFGKKSAPEEKTATYLKTITEELGLRQPFLEDGKFKPVEQNSADSKTVENQTDKPKPDLNADYCRLDLSGDVHHYARYWGEDTRKFGDTTDKFHSDNYASLVAGGGGAFFDVTKTLIGKPLDENKRPIFKDRKIQGEIPPQRIYPSIKKSVAKTADKLFDLWNLRRGGYVQHAGFVVAVVLFYFLTYFSNVSKVLDKNSVLDLSSFGKLFNKPLFISLLFFLGSIVLTVVTVLSVKNLIRTIKEKAFKNRINKTSDAGIWQYAFCFIPLALGIPLYFYGLANLYDNRNSALQRPNIDYFLISCNLLINFLLAALVFWLSSEHTNWLAVRFKIFRKFNIRATSLNWEDPNKPTNSLFKRWLGKLSRLYSYQYIFSNALILAAIGVLITGVNTFGAVSISRTLSDTLLIVVIVGMLVVVVYFLAIQTGAGYHRSWLNKSHFIVIGVWHYLLQIITPLVLFFCGSWFYLLVNFLLVGFFNGSALFSYAVRYFFVKENEKSKWENVADFKVGAWLTKHLNKYVLFFVWFSYGFALNFTALFFSFRPSVYESIKTFFENNAERFPAYDFLKYYLTNFFNVTPQVFDSRFTIYCTIWVSILVVGYIGFLMSRVWLSWYLAVTMLFDGHNNEAGGAARIEGFKHILRIKIERVYEEQKVKDKLTVFVIGFDEAKSEMEDFNLILVDKFTLESKPIR